MEKAKGFLPPKIQARILPFLSRFLSETAMKRPFKGPGGEAADRFQFAVDARFRDFARDGQGFEAGLEAVLAES